MREKAILVGIDTAEPGEDFSQSMEELALLAATAGAETVRTVVQRRGTPDAAYYIGEGKAREIADLVKRHGAALVIFNDELSPSQVRNLERLLSVKTIDRTALILDIFARRAQSREGKLQVELAQLQYLLPRLAGLGKQLSRLGGGIGTRGPGETQLEVDRRVIRRRLAELRREIESLRRHRQLHRRRRKKNDLTVAGLVGYTNAGKSTLLNALTGAAAYTEDKLFATLDPAVRRGTVAEGKTVLFADTVGFIHRLPPQLWSAFQATLEEIVAADLLLHVVDLSHPDFDRQIRVVREHLGRLDERYFQRELLVFNKIDAVTAGPSLFDFLSREFPGACFVSARTGRGLPALKDAIAAMAGRELQRRTFYFPYRQNALYFRLKREGIILETRYHAHYLEVLAEVGATLYHHLREFTTPPQDAAAGKVIL